MDKGYAQQALEWFERGDHDVETAQLLYDQEGYTDTIAYHIQQAAEKYLKGYLVYKGHKPPRIHELDTLLNGGMENGVKSTIDPLGMKWYQLNK